jgi:hypothetical protein
MKVQADRLKEIAIRILKGLHAAEDEAAVADGVRDNDQGDADGEDG